MDRAGIKLANVDIYYNISNTEVGALEVSEKKNFVYINSGRYFGPISKDMWEYQIGGYLVMDKWLKYRKGRQLSLADIKHYCRIATVIRETINVQEKIDGIYSDIENRCVSI